MVDWKQNKPQIFLRRSFLFKHGIKLECCTCKVSRAHHFHIQIFFTFYNFKRNNAVFFLGMYYYICLYTNLPTQLLTMQPTHLTTCLPNQFPPFNLPIYLSLPAHLPTYLPTSLSAYLPTYLTPYLHINLLTPC